MRKEKTGITRSIKVAFRLRWQKGPPEGLQVYTMFSAAASWGGSRSASQQKSGASRSDPSTTPSIDHSREHQPSLKPSGNGGVLGRGVLNGIRPSASGTSNSVFSTPSIRDSSRTNHLASEYSSGRSDEREDGIGKRPVCAVTNVTRRRTRPLRLHTAHMLQTGPLCASVDD